MTKTKVYVTTHFDCLCKEFSSTVAVISYDPKVMLTLV